MSEENFFEKTGVFSDFGWLGTGYEGGNRLKSNKSGREKGDIS